MGCRLCVNLLSLLETNAFARVVLCTHSGLHDLPSSSKMYSVLWISAHLAYLHQMKKMLQCFWREYMLSSQSVGSNYINKKVKVPFYIQSVLHYKTLHQLTLWNVPWPRGHQTVKCCIMFVSPFIQSLKYILKINIQ